MNVMTIDYSRTINQNWNNDEDKNCWTRRSQLEKCLLIILLLLVTSTIGYFVYISMNHKAEPNICITQECLLAASEIISFIDTNIDPCEDFFKFSCGKFIQDIHGDREAASQFSVEALTQRQLKEIIEEPINDEDHYLVRSQKELFRACMNESDVEDKSLEIFQEMLDEIDGWPVVVGHHWIARRFDWKDMIYEMRNRGYDYNTLLSIQVASDPDDSNRQVIAIGEPVYADFENRELYKNYMIEVAVAFGAKENLAKNEMEDVLVFMEKLKRVRKNNSNYSLELSTIEEFQDNHNEIDWLDFINGIIYPVEGISGEDVVLFPSSKYIEDFFFLLHRTSKRVQANYIIWKVIEDIMPYLPKQIKQININYRCTLKTKSIASSSDRFEECKNLIERRYFPRPLDVIYARRYLSSEKKEEIQRIYEDIKTELLTTLEEITWLDEESKANSLKKANLLKVTIGFQNDYFNDTIFDKFPIYNQDDLNEGYGEDSDALLNIYLKTTKQAVNTLYSFIHFNESFYDLVEDGIVFFEDVNMLILKAPALQGIYYDRNRPHFMNYGTLGYKIGKQIVQGFDVYGSEFDGNGTQVQQWTNETINAFEEQTKCFRNDIEEADLSIGDVDVEWLQARNIRSAAGAKLAYSAYRSWVVVNEEEAQLPGIPYSPNQLFWVSTVLPNCYNLVEGLDIERDIFQVTASMRHSWEFAQDFNCPTDSKMNPSEKCQIY